MKKTSGNGVFFQALFILQRISQNNASFMICPLSSEGLERILFRKAPDKFFKHVPPRECLPYVGLLVEWLQHVPWARWHFLEKKINMYQFFLEALLQLLKLNKASYIYFFISGVGLRYSHFVILKEAHQHFKMTKLRKSTPRPKIKK